MFPARAGSGCGSGARSRPDAPRSLARDRRLAQPAPSEDAAAISATRAARLDEGALGCVDGGLAYAGDRHPELAEDVEVSSQPSIP